MPSSPRKPKGPNGETGLLPIASLGLLVTEPVFQFGARAASTVRLPIGARLPDIGRELGEGVSGKALPRVEEGLLARWEWEDVEFRDMRCDAGSVVCFLAD